jgi:competence protein ComFC
VTTIELNNIEHINLSYLGWDYDIYYSTWFGIITIDTNKGYQLILHEGKLLHNNILNDKRLLTNSLDATDEILWIEDESILIQKKEGFLSSLNGEYGFGYNYHKVKLNKLYFLGKNFLCRYLSKRNIIAIFGMAHNSVGKGKKTHWSSRACLTIWDLDDGKLLLEFFPDDAYNVDNLEISPDEEYLYISQVYEWQDLYLFRLSDFKMIYKDGFTDPTPAETGTSIGCFYDNKFIIPSMCGYDGWMGNFRYFDLIENNLHFITDRESEPELSFHCMQLYDNALLAIESGKFKCYDIRSILAGDFKEITYEADFDFGSIYPTENSNFNTFQSFLYNGENLILIDASNKIYISKFKIITNSKHLMDINPQTLTGHWKAGFALDLHTLSSFPQKDAEGNNILDSNGKIKWDTKRPPIAEELYKLKYWKERHHVGAIAVCAGDFLNKYKAKWELDFIIPIPPSDTTREFQPVYELAKAIGLHCNLPVDFKTLVKLKSTSQLKEIEDPEQRKEVLKDAFSIQKNVLNGKDVLLFDDLYRSGETLNAVCDILLNIGNARGVYVLTITKTRTKR